MTTTGEKIILGSVVVVAVLLVAFLVFGRSEPAAQTRRIGSRKRIRAISGSFAN